MAKQSVRPKTARVARTADDRHQMSYDELVSRHREMDSLISQLLADKHRAFAQVSQTNNSKKAVAEHRRIDSDIADARKRKQAIRTEMAKREADQLNARPKPVPSAGDAVASVAAITIGGR